MVDRIPGWRLIAIAILYKCNCVMTRKLFLYFKQTELSLGFKKLGFIYWDIKASFISTFQDNLINNSETILAILIVKISSKWLISHSENFEMKESLIQHITCSYLKNMSEEYKLNSGRRCQHFFRDTLITLIFITTTCPDSHSTMRVRIRLPMSVKISIYIMKVRVTHQFS